MHNVYIVHKGGICVANVVKETNKLYKISNIKDIFGRAYFWGRQIYKDDKNVFLSEYDAYDYLLNKELEVKSALIKRLACTDDKIDEIVTILDNLS